MPESKSKRRKRAGRKPPPPKAPPRKRRTARWVIPTVFGLWTAGVLVIILNYMQLFGGQVRNELLFGGLGLIAAGFVAATQIYPS